jgi:hypothetical protein
VTLVPDNVTSFPAARLSFAVEVDGDPLPLSTLPGITVRVSDPSGQATIATVHEDDDTFSWIVPPITGTHQVSVVIEYTDMGEPVSLLESFALTVNSPMLPSFGVTSDPEITIVAPAFVDVYSPRGVLLVSNPMTQEGPNYTATFQPANDWETGAYTVQIRDTQGVKQVYREWIERPVYASMPTFFSLPEPARRMIEFLKYDMLSDHEPFEENGAFFDLESYARHWVATVEEINVIPPYTNFAATGHPDFWYPVILKGTTCSVHRALANRSVTVPRWNGNVMPIQDESHLEGSWQSRLDALWPEYTKERAYLKGRHMPKMRVTIDPWMSFRGGNLAGTTALSLIGFPSWFSRFAGR